MRILTIALLAAATWPAGAWAAGQGCERACLRNLGNRLLASMVAHDPGSLPLSHRYAATENGAAAALPMMTLWRTATGIQSRYYVIDPQSRQLFFVAAVAEGEHDSLVFGRIAVDHDARLSQVEIYTNRSMGDGGFQFGLQDGPMQFPSRAWTRALRPDQRESRAALLRAGRSIFDPALTAPPVAAGCLMMENGKYSDDNFKVLKYLLPPTGRRTVLQHNAKGLGLVPCMNPAQRPADRLARTGIADRRKGIVVSMAMIPGVVQPYLVTNPSESAFVPDAIAPPYQRLLAAQYRSGAFTAPRLQAMPVTAAVAQLFRIYDGKIHGVLLLINVEPPGSKSPWVVRGHRPAP